MPQNYWSEDWEFSERFIPEMIDRICKEYAWGDPVIEIADHNADYCENTDLILTLRKWGWCQFTIAARVRRSRYLNFADEFTIRNFLGRDGYLYKDENGCLVGDTEYQKLRKGYGDIECYCIADREEKNLATFSLGSLDSLRRFVEVEALKYHEWRTVETDIGDTGKVLATWKPSRQQVAKRTGCGFLCYKKSEIPDFIIADYQIGRATA